MRLIIILTFAFFMMSTLSSGSFAESKRTPRGMSGYKYKEVREQDKTKKDKEKEKEEEKEEKEEKTEKGPLSPEDILKLMLRHENTQGILDYKVDIIEVTEKSMQTKNESVQKQIFFLAPTRMLTLKDQIPIYYIDEYLFEKIMRQVSIEFMKDETIDGIDCYVIKMKPTERAFEKNVKFYYIAKDDYRKVRIESTRYNTTETAIFNVTDFYYRKIDGKYTVPLRSESRTYDDRDFLLQSTTATFMNWKFNIGLTSSFFDEKLKDYKLYDIVR